MAAERELPPDHILFVDMGTGGDVGQFDASVLWPTVRYIGWIHYGKPTTWLADYGVRPDQSVNLWAD